MFAIAVVAILAVGAFSWIAVDGSNIDATLMEGAISVVARRSEAGSSQSILNALNRIDIEGETLESLDVMLEELN